VKGVRTCEALKGSLTLHAYFANLESGFTLHKPFACLGRFMGLNLMQKEFFSHLLCSKFHNKLKPIII
jgi:hypothetical protein